MSIICFVRLKPEAAAAGPPVPASSAILRETIAFPAWRTIRSWYLFSRDDQGRWLDRYELIKIPADVYQVSHVPFVVLPGDFAVVIAAAVVICFLATLYPSRQAARLDPVQALRFE